MSEIDMRSWSYPRNAGTLNAGTISYSFTTTGYPNDPQTAPWSETFALPKFDVPGATLTRMDFHLTAFINMSAQGTNTGTTAAKYGYHSDGVVIVLPVGYLPLGLSVYLPTDGTISEPPGPFSFDTKLQTGSNNYSVQHAGNPEFARYVGTGATNLSIYGDEFGPDFNAEGPILFGPLGSNQHPIGRAFSNSTAELTVTYKYTTGVPEPSTGAQFACAFLLLGFGIYAHKLRRSAL